MSGTDTPAITIPNPRSSVPSASSLESPGTPGRPSKIEPWHLQRLAVVYVHSPVNIKSSTTKSLPRFRPTFAIRLWPGAGHPRG